MKTAFFFVIIFLVSGCGIKNLAVKNLDHLVLYEFSRKIPLNSEGKKVSLKDIQKSLERTKPRARELGQLVEEIDLSERAKIEGQLQRLEKIYREVLEEFNPLVAREISRVEEKKRKKFLHSLREDLKKTLTRSTQDKIKSMEKRFKYLFGEVLTSQKEIITHYAPFYHQRDILRGENKGKLIDEFERIGNEATPLQEKENQLLKALINYQATLLEGARYLEFIQKVVVTLSVKQKNHFKNHLQDLRELLELFQKTSYASP